ncbi:TNF receptor-associated factor 1-like isoform X2 [Heterodontus francisci]|uniref:TNF receptor-associated factor 1-like isoform X2 n=1 Tax=Heterodontus francisci TaxID=7792 RepID=UPI00355C782D
MTAGKSSLSVLPKPTRSQFALTVFPAVRPAAAADLCLFISFIHWHCPPVREMVARVSGIVPIDLCSSTGLLCSSCGFLLIQPKQTKCGHRYCTACLDCLFLTSDEADCCICQERFHCSEVYADRAAENDAFTTVVECPERKAGCDWKGSLRSYLGHISMCSQCKDDCSLCGKKGLSKEELNKHCDVDLGDCPRVKVACPFERAGCQEKPERGALSEHLREAQQPHMMQLLSLILSLQSKMSNTADINTSFKQLVMDKILALTGLLSQSVRPEAGSEASRAGMASGSEDPSISMLAKKIESLEKVLCVLNRELDKYESTIELLQQKCLQNEQVIQDLQRKGKAKEGKNYLFGPSPPMNCNGVIVWKIENFSSHLLAARSEQRTSFYSSPFSTDPFGYKLCCRIYPYGDGNGKGTHISLFLAIMKSEYDDVLLWPFKQRVTFVLLDQVNQNHIKESFFPDVLSASFQKPKTHMNVASGCPRFVRQDLLLNPPNPYLRNDAIFLKVVVDTSGL